jgi:hypothetical protein
MTAGIGLVGIALQQSANIIVLFVETPCKFITAKLSICKPGSSSVLRRFILLFDVVI